MDTPQDYLYSQPNFLPAPPHSAPPPAHMSARGHDDYYGQQFSKFTFSNHTGSQQAYNDMPPTPREMVADGSGGTFPVVNNVDANVHSLPNDHRGRAAVHRPQYPPHLGLAAVPSYDVARSSLVTPPSSHSEAIHPFLTDEDRLRLECSSEQFFSAASQNMSFPLAATPAPLNVLGGEADNSLSSMASEQDNSTGEPSPSEAFSFNTLEQPLSGGDGTDKLLAGSLLAPIPQGHPLDFAPDPVLFSHQALDPMVQQLHLSGQESSKQQMIGTTPEGLVSRGGMVAPTSRPSTSSPSPSSMTHLPALPASSRDMLAQDTNQFVSLCTDSATGELGWILEPQTTPFQTTPILSGGIDFPTRPLMPGVLARIHNDWLDEYPLPRGSPVGEGVPPMSACSERGSRSGFKQFPTPQTTFESGHLRHLWQELEKRRILQMTDDNVLGRLRHEAVNVLRWEAAQMMRQSTSTSHQEDTRLSAVPVPTEEQIDAKMHQIWRQTRKSAVYAVALLRQAEYCLANAHLGFMPLKYIPPSSAEAAAMPSFRGAQPIELQAVPATATASSKRTRRG